MHQNTVFSLLPQILEATTSLTQGDTERALIDTLPGPPALAKLHTTNVWIIEWLSPEEQHTGRKLHDWLETKRPGWSVYCPCETKADVFSAINRAQVCAQNGMVPVLHLECHGGEDGIAPSQSPYDDCITWEELTEPLQRLNLATRCNLAIVVAACVGFAGVQTFRQGPRAPAVALVGPDAKVTSDKLLAGTKELYRRWMDTPTLAKIAESASHEMGEVRFELEPFATMCHETMIELLIRSARPSERLKGTEMMRHRLQAETELTSAQIENRLAQSPLLLARDCWQQIWDQMFMIDICPENRARFGIDVKDIVERIERFSDKQVNGLGCEDKH